MKLEKLRGKALEQAKGTSFLDLAAILLRLKEQDTAEFNKAFKDAGLSQRKAYYLAEIAEQLQPFMEHRARLEEIGWTKLAIIVKHLTKKNARSLLKLAEENTAHQLIAIMRNETPPSGSRTILLRLSPEDYEQFANVILDHGGERTGRGLRNQEQALMRIIKAMTPR